MNNHVESTLLELLLMESTQPDGKQRQCETTRDVGHREKMLVHFSRMVKQEWRTIQNFVGECRKLTDRGERIRILKPFFLWISASQEYKNKFMKSSQKSAAHLEKVKLFFNKGLYQKALSSCNQAIAFAPAEGPDLASAFYWRSLILYQLNDPAGALQDLQLALTTHNFPRNNTKSIYGLKTTFQTAIDQAALSFSSSSASSCRDDDLEKNLDENKKDIFFNNIFRLKSPNPLAPAMENFVKIEYNSERGRHLLVTEDVEIGVTVLLETPIVTSLDGTLKMDTVNCHHCLKKCLRLIPCLGCVFVFFCNDVCKMTAHFYHQFECPCLPDLREILREGVTDNFYLAFKLICTMGPQKMYKIFEMATPPSPLEENGIEGHDPKTKIYDSQSYHTVCHLVFIFEPQEILYPLLALMLSHVLKENCPNFFAPDIVPTECKLEFQNFLAQQLLHHFECFSKNVFSLGILTTQLGSDCDDDGDFRQFASRILPTASLVNHSCDPNVKMFSKGTFGTCALLTLRPLKRGEELLISYGPLFYADGKIERRKLLRKNYHFDCTCPPCQWDWDGIEENFELESPKFFCAQCRSNLDYAKSEMSDMEKIVLNPQNKFRCSSCGLGYEENEILDKFSDMKKAALHARQLMEKEVCPLEAVEAFANILPYFSNNLVQPSFDRVMNQEFFSEAIYKIINYDSK